MHLSIFKYFKRLWERQWRRNRHQLIVSLDDDSLERLERLKAKIRTFDNSALFSSALKCLEDKTDRLIKRQIARTIWALIRGGLGSDEIASYLNDRSIPGLRDITRWQSRDISRLMEEESDGSLRHLRNVNIRNH